MNLFICALETSYMISKPTETRSSLLKGQDGCRTEEPCHQDLTADSRSQNFPLDEKKAAEMVQRLNHFLLLYRT